MPVRTPVDLLCEQLWGPLLSAGSLRVDVGRGEKAGWTTVERYWMVPDAHRARLIVPAGPRPVTRRLLTNYRGLRRPMINLVRAGLGTGASAGLPSGRAMLKVQIPERRPEIAEQLPLRLLGNTLGPVYAATGVRSGDNRKATLHLVDGRGEPVGYAKVGWNATIDQAIEAEGSTLKEIDGGTSKVRAPRVIAELDYAGHPIMVTSPLPLAVRPVRPGEVSAQEMYTLMPVVRYAAISRTSHYRTVLTRLGALQSHTVVGEMADHASELLQQIARETCELPVVSRWHGDFAPWNTARDADETLWVWDWESSEPDAVAGLDALHWSASAARLAARPEPGVSRLLESSHEYLTAAGIPARGRWAVAACYIATMVERACSLAAQANSWGDSRQSPDELRRLLSEARQGLTSEPEQD